MSDTQYDVLVERGDKASHEALWSYNLTRAQIGGDPLGLEALLACVQRGTYTGVLESALHLPVADFELLRARVLAARKKAESFV